MYYTRDYPFGWEYFEDRGYDYFDRWWDFTNPITGEIKSYTRKDIREGIYTRYESEAEVRSRAIEDFMEWQDEMLGSITDFSVEEYFVLQKQALTKLPEPVRLLLRQSEVLKGI